MAKRKGGFIVDLGNVPRHCDIEELPKISVPLFDGVSQKKMGEMTFWDLMQKFK